MQRDFSPHQSLTAPRAPIVQLKIQRHHELLRIATALSKTMLRLYRAFVEKSEQFCSDSGFRRAIFFNLGAPRRLPAI
jgi:hypothetical protein